MLLNEVSEFTDGTWEDCIHENLQTRWYSLWISGETFHGLTNLFDTADIKYSVYKRVVFWLED
jgi:hypothetical protein